MSDVFQVLRKDHEEVESILSRLVGTSPDAADLAEKLVMEESRHEAVEEMYFWPAVEEKVDGGQQLAERALSQENEGKEVLDQLRKAEPGSREFGELVTRFASAGRAHISYEETQVWPRLKAVLSTEEREQLGTKIEEAKTTAPTRPHPHAPDSPGGLKTVGAATAMVDKAADKVTGRGE